MIARERERTRERENYERIIEHTRDERVRSFTGKVVVRGKDVPWEQGRQAKIKMYMAPSRHTGRPPQTALDFWRIFVQEIWQHSGKHRHQGGLVIYVIEGAGYTIVEGERLEWEAGDLLLLPMKPGGVEHQHFNRYPDKPAKWIAFINPSVKEWGASDMIQLEEHPDYQKSRQASARSRR